MQTQRTVDGAPSPASPEVPPRSASRATARRASNRRATARQHQHDVEGRIIGYLKQHPVSTTGDLAKGLKAKRDTIAAGRAHVIRAGDVSKG